MNPETIAGKQLLQQGDLSNAILKFEQAATQYPQDYDTQSLLGSTYSRAGRHDDAIRVLTQAVHIQPTNPQARYNLAVAMHQGGWKDQAIQALEQAVQLKPDYVQAQQALSQLRLPAPTASVSAVPTSAIPGAMPLNSLESAMPYAPSQAGSVPYAAPAPYTQQSGTHGAPPYSPPQNAPYGQQPGMQYGAPQGSPYSSSQPLRATRESESDGMGMGTAIGISLLVAVGVGVAYGVVCNLAGIRIVYLHLLIGFIMGKVVEKLNGSGTIAAVFTLISVSIGLAVMYFGGAGVSPTAIIPLVIAPMLAYRIAES